MKELKVFRSEHEAAAAGYSIVMNPAPVDMADKCLRQLGPVEKGVIAYSADNVAVCRPKSAVKNYATHQVHEMRDAIDGSPQVRKRRYGRHRSYRVNAGEVWQGAFKGGKLVTREIVKADVRDYIQDSTVTYREPRFSELHTVGEHNFKDWIFRTNAKKIERRIQR
jgi:hypothetical protein